VPRESARRVAKDAEGAKEEKNPHREGRESAEERKSLTAKDAKDTFTIKSKDAKTTPSGKSDTLQRD
jgi:hypothetical protein